MSKIFVGMPAYNGERFIGESINSLLQQTFKDWVLFVSDDASTDKTRNIVEEFTKKDKRIFYYRQESNLGLFANFKYTLDKANGEYFIWLAQDDLWEKDFLEVCLSHLETNKNLGLVTTCLVAIDSFGRTVLETPWMTKRSGYPGYLQIAKYIMEPESLGKCNLMYGLFRTEVAKVVWQAYPQRRVWGQDYMFSLAIVARYGVYVDDKMLFKKRLGGYSSPQFDLKDARQITIDLNIKNAKNQIFPFGRFITYLKGHQEALEKTPYHILAWLLLLRLPRSLLIHIKERSFINFIKRKLFKK